jgi:hypothetical protein
MKGFGRKERSQPITDEEDEKKMDEKDGNKFFNRLKNFRKKNRAITENRSNLPKESLKDAFEDHRDVLKNYKTVLSDVLIEDVNKNYPLFLSFSKEISNVETELIELGKLWNEMKNSLYVVSEINSNRDEFKYVGNFKSDLNHEGMELNETKRTFELFKDILIDFRTAVESRDWSSSCEQYEKATSHIETYKLKQTNPQLVESFRRERDNFSSTLLSELESPVISYSTIEFIIPTLKKLNLKEKACSIYLSVKSNQIQENIKKINSTGNILVFAKFSQIDLFLLVIFRESSSPILGNLVWNLQNYLMMSKHLNFLNGLFNKFNCFVKILELKCFQCVLMNSKLLQEL